MRCVTLHIREIAAYIYSMDLKTRKTAADGEGNRKKKSHKKKKKVIRSVGE